MDPQQQQSLAAAKQYYDARFFQLREQQKAQQQQLEQQALLTFQASATGVAQGSPQYAAAAQQYQENMQKVASSLTEQAMATAFHEACSTYRLEANTFLAYLKQAQTAGQQQQQQQGQQAQQQAVSGTSTLVVTTQAITQYYQQAVAHYKTYKESAANAEEHAFAAAKSLYVGKVLSDGRVCTDALIRALATPTGAATAPTGAATAALTVPSSAVASVNTASKPQVAAQPPVTSVPAPQKQQGPSGKDLWDAASSGDATKLGGLLKQKPSQQALDWINEKKEEKTTALAAACSKGHIACAKLLLDAGAGVNVHQKKGGLTALMAAANQGDAGLVRLLLEKGADVHAVEEEVGHK